jgi:hypothetical protein
MLAALGTLAAVGLAIWSTAREAKARASAESRATIAEREREAERARSDQERADQREAKRLEQARQVLAWVEHRPAHPDRPHFDASGLRRLTSEHVLCFINHSSAPVFDVTVHVYWQSYNTDNIVESVAVLPAEASRELVIPDQFQEDGFAATGLVHFRDLNGRHWRRWENGYLNELDEHGQETGRSLR